MTPAQETASDAFFRALASSPTASEAFLAFSLPMRSALEEALLEYVKHWRSTHHGENMETDEKQEKSDLAMEVLALLCAHGCIVGLTGPQKRHALFDLRNLLAKNMKTDKSLEALSEETFRARARSFLAEDMENPNLPRVDRYRAAGLLLSGGK